MTDVFNKKNVWIVTKKEYVFQKFKAKIICLKILNFYKNMKINNLCVIFCELSEGCLFFQ